MDQNKNFSKEFINTYVNSDIFLTRIGTTWWMDSIYLFVIPPISLLGLLLNLLSLFILFKMDEKKYFIFKILKIYCINSSIICIIAFFSFYVGSPRYIGFRLDYLARAYYCVLINYVGITFYFCGNVLNVIISIERSSIFLPSLNKIQKLKTISLYILIVVLCHVINLPSLFRYYVKNDDELYEELIQSYLTSTFYMRCGKWFLFGQKIYYLINIIIRDVITLIFEMTFTLLTLYYFVKFQTKKAILLNKSRANQTTNIKNKNEESRMTSMSLYLTISSLITHSVVFFANFSLVIYESALAATGLIMFSVLATSIKHSSNFLIFYFFNKKFKAAIKTFFNNNYKEDENNEQDAVKLEPL